MNIFLVMSLYCEYPHQDCWFTSGKGYLWEFIRAKKLKN